MVVRLLRPRQRPDGGGPAGVAVSSSPHLQLRSPVTFRRLSESSGASDARWSRGAFHRRLVSSASCGYVQPLPEPRGLHLPESVSPHQSADAACFSGGVLAAREPLRRDYGLGSGRYWVCRGSSRAQRRYALAQSPLIAHGCDELLPFAIVLFAVSVVLLVVVSGLRSQPRSTPKGLTRTRESSYSAPHARPHISATWCHAGFGVFVLGLGLLP